MWVGGFLSPRKEPRQPLVSCVHVLQDAQMDIVFSLRAKQSPQDRDVCGSPIDSNIVTLYLKRLCCIANKALCWLVDYRVVCCTVNTFGNTMTEKNDQEASPFRHGTVNADNEIHVVQQTPSSNSGTNTVQQFKDSES